MSKKAKDPKPSQSPLDTIEDMREAFEGKVYALNQDDIETISSHSPPSMKTSGASVPGGDVEKERSAKVLKHPKAPKESPGKGNFPQETKVGHPPSTPEKAADLPKPSRPRETRVILHPEENKQFQSAVLSLSSTLGTTIKGANVLRALVTLFRHLAPEIDRHINLGRLSQEFHRPLNGDSAALAQLEDQLAELFHAAARYATPFKASSAPEENRQTSEG